jgi:hypothetical protein
MVLGSIEALGFWILSLGFGFCRGFRVLDLELGFWVL